MKFLIVDDSLAMQTIIKLNLEKAGYRGNEFQTAVDGIQALEVIDQWQPDIVITDWHMPKMTGLELLKIVQERQLPLKIGLLTTETDPALLDEATDAGALFVLHKPFEVEELQQTLIPFVGGEGLVQTPKKKAASNVEPIKPLTLPNIGAVNKLARGLLTQDFELERSSSLAINYEYLPYVITLFCCADHITIKAMCVMDIRSAAMLSCALLPKAKQAMSKIIKNKTLSKEQIARINNVMGSMSALFIDPVTNGPLEVKGVHIISKPSEKLDRLGATSKDKRLDLIMKCNAMEEGQVIFMAVAEK